MAPPDFRRSVNPISTRGADYAHQIILAPPDFQTFLQTWVWDQVQISKSSNQVERAFKPWSRDFTVCKAGTICKGAGGPRVTCPLPRFFWNRKEKQKQKQVIYFCWSSQIFGPSDSSDVSLVVRAGASMAGGNCPSPPSFWQNRRRHRAVVARRITTCPPPTHI